MLQPKDSDWLNDYKNKTYIHAVYKKATSDLETHTLKVRKWKELFYANGNQKKVRAATLLADTILFNKNYKR